MFCPISSTICTNFDAEKRFFRQRPTVCTTKFPRDSKSYVQVLPITHEEDHHLNELDSLGEAVLRSGHIRTRRMQQCVTAACASCEEATKECRIYVGR